MKKVILGLLALTSVAIANAQTGTILLGGDLTVGSSKTSDGVKTTVLGINPTIGYQFSDNWTVGVTGGVSYGKQDPYLGSASTALKSTEFNAGPFIRYTQPISDIFAIYGQLEGGYQGHNDKIEDSSSPSSMTTKASGVYARIFPAVFINVKNNFGLNFAFGSLGYSSLKVKGASKADNSFGFTFGNNISIGVSKNF